MRRAVPLAMVLIVAAGLAYAGDWHFGTNLICSDCHIMHASQTHTYGGSPVTYSEPASEYLLKGGINETCLICHNDDGAPDVLGSDTGYFLADRSAGALNDVGGPVDGYDHFEGHTLGSTDTAPGTVGSFVPDATHGLTCVDCHHQHGYDGGASDVFGTALNTTPNGAYRNLAGLGGFGSAIGISYAIGTNDLTRDVFERFSNAYNFDDIDLNEPVPTDSGFGEWCQKCHLNFHGAVGDANSIGGSGAPPAHFIRHPNATVNIGDLGGGHSSLGVFSNWAYRVRVMTTLGDWGTQGVAWAAAPANDLTPTCLSCHKAHGTNRPFGLIYAKGNNPFNENGDGVRATALCQQCHVQGDSLP